MVIGFDVSKSNVNWALVTKSGRRTNEGRCVNTVPALRKVLSAVPQQKHLVAVVESTGTCHRATIAACRQQQIPCRLVNPIQTKQFTQATVRKTKTDRQDARYVALLGLQGAGYVVQAVDPSLEQAQVYLRLGSRLQRLHSTAELLRQYLVETSSTLDTEPLIECQTQLTRSVTTYRQMAADLLNENTAVKLLQTIPGIGPVLAMGIVVEIGNPSRFPSAVQLVAYAGLDPQVKQSGLSSSTGHLTKRGSPHLRHWLFIAAAGAKRCDPELHASYWRQRARGKGHKAATVYVARRLIHRIYAVWKRGTAYEQRPILEAVAASD